MSFFKKSFKVFKIMILLFLLCIGGIFLYVKCAPKITINSANNIILYDKNHSIFFKGSESKEWVELKDISNSLIQATIYTEDKHFYKPHDHYR